MDYNDPNGHLCFTRFGLTNLEERSKLDSMLDEYPAMRPVAVDILTRAAYQADYGIYDHEHNRHNRPLALVAMHEKEDTMEGGLLFKHIRDYHNFKIAKHWKLGLDTYLSYPTYIVELLCDIARSESVKEESVAQELKRQFHQGKSGNGLEDKKP